MPVQGDSQAAVAQYNSLLRTASICIYTCIQVQSVLLAPEPALPGEAHPPLSIHWRTRHLRLVRWQLHARGVHCLFARGGGHQREGYTATSYPCRSAVTHLEAGPYTTFTSEHWSPPSAWPCPGRLNERLGVCSSGPRFSDH